MRWMMDAWMEARVCGVLYFVRDLAKLLYEK